MEIRCFFVKLVLVCTIVVSSNVKAAFTTTRTTKSVSTFSSTTRKTRLTTSSPPPLPLPQPQQQSIHHRNGQATKLYGVLEIIGTSPEPLHTAFTVATFLPQPLWVLLIFFPKADSTKKIMGGMEMVLLVALVHFFIVATSIVQPGATAPLAEFNDVFDPFGDPQKAFMNMVTNYPNFVAEEWSHVLTWDFFVGRWIWLDGLKRGIFTSHSVLFANLIGPPGLLMHFVTCLVTGKGFVGNEAKDT